MTEADGKARPADRSREREVAATAFYDAFESHPSPSRRMGWESASAHAMRLAAIVDALGPVAEVASLVDVGCGEAMLLPVLRRAGFAGNYRGEDVRSAPIARARLTTHEDARAEVVVCDGFVAPREGAEALPRAAAIVCSGALNTVSGTAVDHDLEVEAVLSALWQRAEDVLVIDFAVRDRHAPGVGLATTDLARAWAHARALTPIVAVHEDTVPGEACLVLSRSRARSYSRRMPESSEEARIVRAEALYLADELTAALAVVGGIDSAAALLIVGRTLARSARAYDALQVLRRAVALAEAAGDEERCRAGRLAQAPALWRLGDRRAAEALLEELAQRDDEARGHLFELLLARRDHTRAALVASQVQDAWMRRELEARLA